MRDTSGIKIGEEHIAALRLFLLDEPESMTPFRRDQPEAAATAYTLMIYAAFAIAVRQAFSPEHTLRDIVQYVAALRKSRKEGPGGIDPQMAENMIRAALGDPTVTEANGESDTQVAVRAEIAVLDDLLPKLVTNAEQLEKFLQDADDYARQWIEAQRGAAAG